MNLSDRTRGNGGFPGGTFTFERLEKMISREKEQKVRHARGGKKGLLEKSVAEPGGDVNVKAWAATARRKRSRKGRGAETSTRGNNVMVA